MKTNAPLTSLLRLVLLVTTLTVNQGESQTLHCQPGDAGCQRCSASCNSINPSVLPECCEAFNACCDTYFSACKQCSQIALQDKFFPEYCCASFTSCCDQVTTIKVSPTTKKPPSSASHHLLGANLVQDEFSQGQNALPSVSTSGQFPVTSNRNHRLGPVNRGTAKVNHGVHPSQPFDHAITASVPSSAPRQPQNRRRSQSSTSQRRQVASAQSPSGSSKSVPKRRRITSRGRIVEY